MKTNHITTPPVKAKATKKATRSAKAKLETVTIQTTAAQFIEWNKAALAGNLKITDWIEETLEKSAFLVNKAEQIESIKDLRAFEKASRGLPISFDEFERSQRYRAGHPAESAEAYRRREAVGKVRVKIFMPDAFIKGLDSTTLQSGLSSTLAATTEVEWIQQWTKGIILKNYNLQAITLEKRHPCDFLLNSEHFERVRQAAKSVGTTPEDLLMVIAADECGKMRRWQQVANAKMMNEP